MWTPKRILLLVFGFGVFVAAYAAYDVSPLGGIDGLPPLPEAYLPRVSADTAPPPPRPENQVAKKLRQAFGEDCPELRWSYLIENRPRGIVLAFDAFTLQDDGKVRVAPLSVAVFGKTVDPGQQPEINTVRSKSALLVCDKPIATLNDLGKSRIVAGELQQDIVIVNNRRTPQRDDDLSLSTQGPLRYSEADHRIQTDNVVKITDLQSKPEPTVIDATGLDVFLTPPDKAEPPTPAKGRKARGQTVSDVEKLVLRSGVKMYLWLDARSGFLASGKPTTPPGKVPPARAAAEKARVTIFTGGSFTYDVRSDLAAFESPSQRPGLPADTVQVMRTHEPADEGKHDQLNCDKLEIQFRRKMVAEAKTGSDERGVHLEVETAHATGQQVTLVSDAEVLTAFGNDLTYDARTRLTTLRGEPEVIAAKEGNEIHARELQLVNDKGTQQATAFGTGEIRMLDKATGKRTLKARWAEKLAFSRDGAFDLLTLSGRAGFEDEAQGQKLESDVIKVWLEPAQPTTGTKPGPGGRRPHHLEALKGVASTSRELVLRDVDRLVMWFRDVAATPVLVGQPVPTVPGAASPPPVVGPVPTIPGTAPAPGPKTAPRPIDLKARVVEAWVNRTGGKSELKMLRTEGEVRVRQAAAVPEDKGLDIRGDSLTLDCLPEGHKLKVNGDLAQLQLNKILIIGPEVEVDQATNTAQVHGTGLMQMESDTDFQGAKLSRTVPLEVHWDRAMFFNGTYAEFHGKTRDGRDVGGIQAIQEGARLTCRTMKVNFDRPVSLREGDRGGARPKVQSLVCEAAVRVEDRKEESGKLVHHHRIEGPELHLDNEAGTINVAGPGVVRLLQPGSAEPGRVPQPGATRPADVLKLTRVAFRGKMFANNKTHMASFYDNIEVVSLPAGSLDTPVDLERLGKDVIHLRCGELKVYRNPGDVSSGQQFEARRQVRVRSAEFEALAEVVTYHEGKDQLIFDGGVGGQATLYRKVGAGADMNRMTARKIFYLRKTGKVWTEDATGIVGD